MDNAELLAALRQMYATRSAEVRQRWERSLPFGDCVVDRWERARELGFGEGAES